MNEYKKNYEERRKERNCVKTKEKEKCRDNAFKKILIERRERKRVKKIKTKKGWKR